MVSRSNGVRMRAWQVTHYGEPTEALALVDVPVPVPGPSQVLVKVLAAGINFFDILLCRGTYQQKPELPFTLGGEVCGEVVAVGSDVSWPNVGERIVAMSALPTGAFAQYSVVNAINAFPAPEQLSNESAAAFHVSYLTSWFGLHRRAGLRSGETLLVHAAVGGVGSAAVELGKAAGAQVIGVVGGPEKAKIAKQLGTDAVIDRTKEDVVKSVLDLTQGRGADVIYDPVGGQAYRQSVRCIAFEGRIVVVGFAGGEIQTAAVSHALVKNYSIMGLHFGLYVSRDQALVRAADEELRLMVARGQINPLVSEVATFDALPVALEKLAKGETYGRIVLR